jgi:hypothetical protein
MICSPCQAGYHEDCQWGACACPCWRPEPPTRIKIPMEVKARNFKGFSAFIWVGQKVPLFKTSSMKVN